MSLDIAKQICEIGKLMYNRELVASHDGNISVKLNDNEIMITPTLTRKGDMQPENMVVIDFNGNVVRGSSKPSSEYKLHLEVYKNRADVKAVVHAHPITASAFSIVGRDIDMKYMPEAVKTLGVIRVAPYAEPGTEGLPASIKPYIAEHNGVLLSNHGAVTWADSLDWAYNLMEQLEFYCKVVVTAEQIGKPRTL